LGVWHWSPAAFVFDHRLGEWTAVRSARCASGLPDWDDLRARASKPAQAGFMLEGVAPAVTPERYARIVERAVEYIRAGDAFQVNLAHPLRGRWSGSPRALFAAMHREAEPPYGAYIEDGDVSGPEERTIIASISPELFLRLDRAIGTVTTRPIKGTRSAIGGQAQAAAAGLLGSAKDAAELAMIVDLMRNDLGRVCRFGSVRVTEPRTLESHAGAGPAERSSLLHTAAEVAGRLGPGVGVGGLLRATYPAGSITGAPKIRAMQIIEELERGVGGLGPDLGFARGPYTGAIGLASTHRLVLSVAIRTAVLRGTGAFEFSAGAGIVADSDPASEWRETLDKAGLVLRLSGDCRERASAAAQRLTPYGAAR
jgi:para-aminobenzoate synthetase component 1